MSLCLARPTSLACPFPHVLSLSVHAPTPSPIVPVRDLQSESHARYTLLRRHTSLHLASSYAMSENNHPISREIRADLVAQLESIACNASVAPEATLERAYE